MRRYDDPVEVRRGMVEAAAGPVEGPEQFLWRGRLWTVVDVAAHWVETGPWWQSAQLAPLFGTGEEQNEDAPGGGLGSAHDLLAEREVWRVAAGCGVRAARAGSSGLGVFELVFDWADGGWRLARCLD